MALASAGAVVVAEAATAAPPARAAAAAEWPVSTRVTVATVVLVLGCATAALAFFFLALNPTASRLPPFSTCIGHAKHLPKPLSFTTFEHHGDSSTTAAVSTIDHCWYDAMAAAYSPRLANTSGVVCTCDAVQITGVAGVYKGCSSSAGVNFVSKAFVVAILGRNREGLLRLFIAAAILTAVDSAAPELPDDAGVNVLPPPPPSPTLPLPPPSPTLPPPPQEKTRGAVVYVGVAAAVVSGALALTAGVVWLCCRRRRRQQEAPANNA